MSDRTDGGPAFPGWYQDGRGPIWADGLSKREYFAAMALQGFLSNPTINIEKSGLCGGSFNFADKMIRAGKGEK